ncbi:MAG: thiamine phosphate synthase [Lactobacillus sp.]|jgi:thiamine-phosphate pyrophosphorylase|nr:thiamine phosphate synthase [Lactobacillus sp.]
MKFDKTMLHTYFIAGTPDIPAGETLEDVVRQALDAGITAFQFREKGPDALTGLHLLTMAQRLQKLCGAYHIPFIVDNDVDLAHRLHADGVHVGQTDAAAAQVVAQVSQEMFIGLSCHTKAQVEAANHIPGISYIGSGAIYTSPSKASAPVIGLAGLTALTQISHRPIVAIGGINAANLKELPATGVAGAAVISLIARSHDIAQTVAAMNAIDYSI